MSMGGLSDEHLKKLLARHSKAELAEWIVERSANDEDLRRALIGLVAPRADTPTLVSELKRIITKAWQRTRTHREPWTLARPIAAELEPVPPALDQLIGRGQAMAAEKVARRFVEAADKGLAHIDDSYGCLLPLCHEVVTLWGKAWAKIEPRDVTELAQIVYDGVRENGYAVRDHMIRDFAEALGREGLLALKAMLLAEHQATLADKALNDWHRREPPRHLTNIADALGDVDMYIDVQRQCGLLDRYALPIARRLLDAGRAAEALAYIDRADPDRSFFLDEKDDWTTLRVKILQALGRDGEARDTLWQAFGRTLNTTALDHLLALTPANNQPTLMDRAIAAAEAYPDKLTAATFLLGRGLVGRAAAIIDEYPDQFDGRDYSKLLPLAEALEHDYPAAAWVLYRSLLLGILEEKRSKAYHHAAEYLAIAGELTDRAGMHERHQALLAQLQSEHGRKYGFWRLVRTSSGALLTAGSSTSNPRVADVGTRRGRRTGWYVATTQRPSPTGANPSPPSP
ncbi:MAG: hypothetical protein JJU36_01430 [Phycisphaeraceae bacterium]|nr:hypothetical protein [Phycisphaeraceae bacterium]